MGTTGIMTGDSLVGVPTAGLSCGSARVTCSVCEVSSYSGTKLFIYICIVCLFSFPLVPHSALALAQGIGALIRPQWRSGRALRSTAAASLSVPLSVLVLLLAKMLKVVEK